MPYNEKLDARVLKAIAGWNISKKKMFGGTCYLFCGNMMCGVYEDYLILRLGEAQSRKTIEMPGVKPFDATGKVMKGWVMVKEKECKGKKLDAWLEKARQFVRLLPPK